MAGSTYADLGDSLDIKKVTDKLSSFVLGTETTEKRYKHSVPDRAARRAQVRQTCSRFCPVAFLSHVATSSAQSTAASLRRFGLDAHPSEVLRELHGPSSPFFWSSQLFFPSGVILHS